MVLLPRPEEPPAGLGALLSLVDLTLRGSLPAPMPRTHVAQRPPQQLANARVGLPTTRQLQLGYQKAHQPSALVWQHSLAIQPTEGSYRPPSSAPTRRERRRPASQAALWRPVQTFSRGSVERQRRMDCFAAAQRSAHAPHPSSPPPLPSQQPTSEVLDAKRSALMSLVTLCMDVPDAGELPLSRRGSAGSKRAGSDLRISLPTPACTDGPWSVSPLPQAPGSPSRSRPSSSVPSSPFEDLMRRRLESAEWLAGVAAAPWLEPAPHLGSLTPLVASPAPRWHPRQPSSSGRDALSRPCTAPDGASRSVPSRSFQ